MNFRFHIQNKQNAYRLMIAIDWGRRGGVQKEDFIFYTDTAFNLLCPIETSYEHEQQAQYALTDVRSFLNNQLARWRELATIQYQQLFA